LVSDSPFSPDRQAYPPHFPHLLLILLFIRWAKS
jgi:hypothetical protein